MWRMPVEDLTLLLQPGREFQLPTPQGNPRDLLPRQDLQLGKGGAVLQVVPRPPGINLSFSVEIHQH